MCTPWHCPQEGRLAHDKSCQDLSAQVAQFPACQYLVHSRVWLSDQEAVF